jgi:hypothetical protein
LEPIGIRYTTQRKEMLAELKGGSAGTMEKFVARLQQAPASHAEVRQSQRLTTLLVLDVDETATKKELEGH